MFTLKRVTTVPGSPLKVMVDHPADGDGGFGMGGSFYFMPAGQEGDTHPVSEHAARIIMGDAGQAHHFECCPALPPLPDPEPESEPESEPAADRSAVNEQPDSAKPARGRRKKDDQG